MELSHKLVIKVAGASISRLGIGERPISNRELEAPATLEPHHADDVSEVVVLEGDAGADHEAWALVEVVGAD